MNSTKTTHDQAGPTKRAPRSRVQNLARLTRQKTPAAIIQQSQVEPGSLASGEVVQLQRTVGNQAVEQLLSKAEPQKPDRALQPLLLKQSTPMIQRVEDKTQFITRLTGDVHARKLTNFIPPTGLGKFDAEYDVAGGQLYITVKIFLKFANTIPNDKQLEFKSKFRQNTADKFNNPFTIKCIKPGWDDLTAKPVIRVILLTNETGAHYVIDINNQETLASLDDGTPVGGFAAVSAHSDVNPETTPTGGLFQLAHADVTAAAARSANVDVAQQEADRVSILLPSINPIQFATSSDAISAAEEVRITNFVTQVLAEQGPRMATVPVGLIATGYANKRELFNRDLSGRRAQGVAVALMVKAGAPPKLVVRSAKGGTSGDRKVNLAIDDEFTANWKNKKVVVTHEFGHMLGLPDFYRGAPDNPRTQHQKQEFTRLVTTSANVGEFGTPNYNVLDASLMSTGTLIFKDYFVTLVDALARITGPTIAYNEWQIE